MCVVTQVRRYSKRNEKFFSQIGAAFGRTPYYYGKLTTEGYLSFFEGTALQQFSLKDRLAIQPMMTFSGEQVIENLDINADGVEELRISSVRTKLTVYLKLLYEVGNGATES